MWWQTQPDSSAVLALPGSSLVVALVWCDLQEHCIGYAQLHSRAWWLYCSGPPWAGEVPLALVTLLCPITTAGPLTLARGC